MRDGPRHEDGEAVSDGGGAGAEGGSRPGNEGACGGDGDSCSSVATSGCSPDWHEAELDEEFDELDTGYEWAPD